MSDEAAFLAHIRARPADDTARLVYADWLEEQGTPEAATRTEFLRLEHTLLALPDDHPAFLPGVQRLRELSAQLPGTWTADVARLPPIENCSRLFQFTCPMKWDRLAPTDDPRMRTCGVCRERVYYCTSIEEARRHANDGAACVTLDLRVDRKAGDLDPPRPPHHEFGLTGVILIPESPADPPPTVPLWWQFWRR